MGSGRSVVCTSVWSGLENFPDQTRPVCFGLDRSVYRSRPDQRSKTWAKSRGEVKRGTCLEADQTRPDSSQIYKHVPKFETDQTRPKSRPNQTRGARWVMETDQTRPDRSASVWTGLLTDPDQTRPDSVWSGSVWSGLDQTGMVWNRSPFGC